MFWATFPWRRTNVWPAKKILITGPLFAGDYSIFLLYSHWILNGWVSEFLYVKVVLCERGLAFCKIILNFPTIFLWRTAVLWRTSHVKRIIYYITWRETIREFKQRHFTRHTTTGDETFFLLIWLVDATKFASCETNCPKIWTKPVLKNAYSIFGWCLRSKSFVLKFPIDLTL